MANLPTHVTNLDELVLSDFLFFVAFSDSARVYGPNFVSSIEPHSEQQMRTWLEELEIPQLSNGNYWKEFLDITVYGGVEEYGTPPGREPDENSKKTRFVIRVSRQAPASLLTRIITRNAPTHNSTPGFSDESESFGWRLT